MPSRASLSRFGVRPAGPRESATRSSIWTDVLVQPCPSPRIKMKLGCLLAGPALAGDATYTRKPNAIATVNNTLVIVFTILSMSPQPPGLARTAQNS